MFIAIKKKPYSPTELTALALLGLAVAVATFFMLDTWWKSTPEYAETQRLTVEVQQRRADLDERIVRAERENARLKGEIAKVKQEIADHCAAVKMTQPAAVCPP